nr:immunoglobulin light chain junction region [Macaca mulatta]
DYYCQSYDSILSAYIF